MNIIEARKKIIVALDVPSAREAQQLARTLKGHVGMVKVGKQLFTAPGVVAGPQIVAMLHKEGVLVFLDLKFHDIPNTVAGASRNAALMQVYMFNVHILGGIEMMKDAKIAAFDETTNSSIYRPLVLGVTILTSLDMAMLRQMKIGDGLSPEEYVPYLARLAQKAGLDGVIASPKEIKAIRKACGDKFVIVTPGVRPLWAQVDDDQKRTMTPGDAIKAGADYLVIGRPIRKYPKEKGGPAKAAELIAEEIVAAGWGI